MVFFFNSRYLLFRDDCSLSSVGAGQGYTLAFVGLDKRHMEVFLQNWVVRNTWCLSASLGEFRAVCYWMQCLWFWLLMVHLCFGLGMGSLFGEICLIFDVRFLKFLLTPFFFGLICPVNSVFIQKRREGSVCLDVEGTNSLLGVA